MRTAFLFLFFALTITPLFAGAQVVINEVAWMGALNPNKTPQAQASDEWIELYNNSSNDIDLARWILTIQNKKDIIFTDAVNKIIPANGYYLIERTDDDTLPAIKADLISSFGKGGLSNDNGEILILKNDSGAEVDKIDALNGWPAGDNPTKMTMQRDMSGKWITAKATPKAINIQNSEITGKGKEETPAIEIAPSLSSAISPEPRQQIFASAGEDRFSMAGAEIEFSGKAFNENGEILDNARFFWNFGDGGYKEGRVARHTYRFPGKYLATLNIASGSLSVSDNALIEVSLNQIFISEIKTGADSWVELYNNSSKKIDISFWKIPIQHFIKEEFFRFPESTFILPKSYLVVPNEILKINFLDSKGVVRLLYSNNLIADEFNYNGVLKNRESFSRINGEIMITSETPGAENKPPDVSVLKEKKINQELNLPTSEQTSQKNPIQSEKAIKSPLKEAVNSPLDQKAAAIETINVESLVSDASDAKEKKSNVKKWLFLSLVIGVFSAVSFLIQGKYSKLKKTERKL